MGEMVFHKTAILIGSLFAALFVLEATAESPVTIPIKDRPPIVVVDNPKPEKPQKSKTPSECIDRVKEQQRDIADKLHDIKQLLVVQKNKKRN